MPDTNVVLPLQQRPITQNWLSQYAANSPTQSWMGLQQSWEPNGQKARQFRKMRNWTQSVADFRGMQGNRPQDEFMRPLMGYETAARNALMQMRDNNFGDGQVSIQPVGRPVLADMMRR